MCTLTVMSSQVLSGDLHQCSNYTLEGAKLMYDVRICSWSVSHIFSHAITHHQHTHFFLLKQEKPNHVLKGSASPHICDTKNTFSLPKHLRVEVVNIHTILYIVFYRCCV